MGDLSQMLSTMFRVIWPSGCRGEDFSKSTNQKRELHVAACLLLNRDEMSFLHRGTSIYVSYHVLVHLAKRFQRRFFHYSTNQKQEWPVVAMFVNGSKRREQSSQSTSIYAAYRVSVQLVMRFQRRIFVQKSANQKQELPVVKYRDLRKRVMRVRSAFFNS